MTSRTLALLLSLAAAAASPAFAQPQTQTMKTDPLRCWWRTTAGAIRVGEPVTVVLTCAVLETEAVTVVVDQSRLEPSVVQFAPFEVLGGGHSVDLHAGDRRFFQYSYQLRLVAENLFGKDVGLPETKLSYRVQSHMGQGSAIEGRDQVYLLPAMSLRVLSLVPGNASDIRDAPGETFADIDQRAFRANLFTVSGGILFAIAGLLALLGIVRLVGRFRKPRTATDRLLPDSAVLRAAGRELAAVQRSREQSGWTPELAARALAALRIVGSYAIGRPVGQAEAVAVNGNSAVDGRLVVRGLWPRGKAALVSGAVTPQVMARARAGNSHPPRQALELESLEQSLARFTAAQYGRETPMDDAELDASIASGLEVLKRLKLEQIWPMRRFIRRKPAFEAGARVWSR